MIGPQDVQPSHVIPVSDTPVSSLTQESPIADLNEIDRLYLGRQLGLDSLKEVVKYKPQLERIAEWAKANGANDLNGVIEEVKTLMARIGSPEIGTNWAQKLSVYTSLQLERLRLDRELRKFEVTDG